MWTGPFGDCQISLIFIVTIFTRLFSLSLLAFNHLIVVKEGVLLNNPRSYAVRDNCPDRVSQNILVLGHRLDKDWFNHQYGHTAARFLSRVREQWNSKSAVGSVRLPHYCRSHKGSIVVKRKLSCNTTLLRSVHERWSVDILVDAHTLPWGTLSVTKEYKTDASG